MGGGDEAEIQKLIFSLVDGGMQVGTVGVWLRLILESGWRWGRGGGECGMHEADVVNQPLPAHLSSRGDSPPAPCMYVLSVSVQYHNRHSTRMLW